MKIDPCNGYVRRECIHCIFYKSFSDHPATYYSCEFNKDAHEIFKCHLMKWVSATDCNRDPEMKEKHYERCFAFVDREELKNTIRKSIICGIRKGELNPWPW